MYVRKFEADSLDEALKEIKQELGPDAIILKTLTNKGFKGAFKKKKIEITAAISEKSYTKKAHVDNVLDDQQRQEFYSGSSSYISNMIDNHSSHKEEARSSGPQEDSVPSASGYGKLGLNRAVNTTLNKTKDISDKMRSSLDDFLSSKQTQGPSGEQHPQKSVSHKVSHSQGDDDLENEIEQASKTQGPTSYQSYQSQAQQNVSDRNQAMNEVNIQELEDARSKIDDLERKLFELTRDVQRIDKREPTGVYQLRTTLRALDINEFYIQDVIKKCCFELTDEELQDQDMVFEFALREMLSEIQTQMPLFSSLNDNQSVVTVLISETSTGQTSMIQKLGALKDNSLIIRNRLNDIDEDEVQTKFAEKIFNMGVIQASGIPEIISQCRKGVEDSRCIFIDYKNKSGEINETKKFIDGLRRSFDKVEVLISLSGIHSESYNRKVVNRYLELADGMVISNLDLCLNYGSLFNIAQGYPQLPLKFYGTGEVIPDDIESATAERILAGVFKLKE